MADVRDLRVVLLIDASNETVAALSDVVCDMLLKPILARLEVLHQGSDHRLAIVSYSIPSSPDGPDLSVTQDTFKSFQDSYNILRHGPLSVGLGRFSNLKGDSMALIDGFIQALKVSEVFCAISQTNKTLGFSFVMERLPPAHQFTRYTISSSSLRTLLRLLVVRLVCPVKLILLCGKMFLLRSKKYDVELGYIMI